MEQEETKTMAAAGAEMPPEVESWVQLHESELTELLQKQATPITISWARRTQNIQQRWIMAAMAIL